jgi:uncharacterized Zn-finger protein
MSSRHSSTTPGTAKKQCAIHPDTRTPLPSSIGSLQSAQDSEHVKDDVTCTVEDHAWRELGMHAPSLDHSETSIHVGISLAERGWTVATDKLLCK